jgi:hypothetical protein
MPDRFASHATSLDAPADTAFAITPNDAADLAETTRAIYVGTSGNLALTMATGGEVTFPAVPGGTVLPVRARRIKAAGTTATGLVGLL